MNRVVISISLICLVGCEQSSPKDDLADITLFEEKEDPIDMENKDLTLEEEGPKKENYVYEPEKERLELMQSEKPFFDFCPTEKFPE